MAARAIDSQNKRYEEVEQAVIAAVIEFSEKYQSLRNGFAIFNPSNGLLHRLESVFNWDIYTKMNDRYVKIEVGYDKREAAAAMVSMPKQGIVALNAYLEAFIHKLLDDTFSALYKDFSRHDLETFTWPDALPFVKNNAHLLHPKNLPPEGKLEELTKVLLQYKDDQLKALSQPNWGGNLESKLAELFIAPVNGKQLLERLLQSKPESELLVWNWQFEDNSGRHKYLVAPRDVQTLASMSNFFYGVRCLIAHGDPKKTTTSGALKSEEPTSNYWIRSATTFITDTADETKLETRERSKCEYVEIKKSFGYSSTKKVVTTKKKRDVITQTTAVSVGKKPNGELVMKQEGPKIRLNSFDKFLDDGTERQAQITLKQHCKELWKMAKDDKLDVDYHLFLSIANFNVYYVKMIALVCLWICHSIIYGNDDEQSTAFQNSLPRLEQTIHGHSSKPK